jgi:hypothetical protein
LNLFSELMQEAILSVRAVQIELQRTLETGPHFKVHQISRHLFNPELATVLVESHLLVAPRTAVEVNWPNRGNNIRAECAFDVCLEGCL